MKRLVELIIKAVVNGLIYTIGFALVGGLAGMLLKKGFIQGAYVAVFAGSVVAMLIASYRFIGSPKSRFASLTHHQYDHVSKPTEAIKPTEIIKPIKDVKAKELDSAENEDLEYKGLYPTIIAIEMLVIGFIIEALLH
ncbi:hypothetical protein [Fusibacter ferrireducens]|uniref:Uncharacterized protein n=1 Tax=Fusibacter ferrireducens TaxID=2785058 RepID=A0ABS0A195_9FIRM|nr:hypothetical protein [Fusibacter ferrireducens]MBF4695644.1 hypothetical protein [Fusibacter ferrireducens]